MVDKTTEGTAAGTVRTDGPANPAPGTIELPDRAPAGFEGFGRITLEGAPNTRDLGGLRTGDGRMIRPHRLVRSGALHDITKDDGELLCAWHQVRRVVDFRTAFERDDKPDDMQLLPGVEPIDLPVLSVAEITGAPEGKKPSRLESLKTLRAYLSRPYETMESMYTEAALGEQGRAAYGDFLRLLLESPEGATLWHCTEGKDRAGMASALVEYVLGVPEADIMADYLATNLFVQTWAERMLDELARHKVLVKVDDDVAALFYANRRFLGDVVGLVRAEYGSIERYVAEGLGYGADEQEALRERYLTDQVEVPVVAKLREPVAGQAA